MLRFPGGLFLVVLLFTSCSPDTGDRTTIQAETVQKDGAPVAYEPEEDAFPMRPPYVQSELDQIRNTLDTIALDLSCSENAHCVALAADDNACGIPLEWLIFSTQAARYGEVEKLLERSFYLDNTYPASRFQVCGGPSQPKLECREGLCTMIPYGP